MTHSAVARPGAPLRLGKKPATRTKRLLKFRDFLDKAALPPLPTGDFGHDPLFVGKNIGMLGNDNYGDCVEAAGAHTVMLHQANAGNPKALSLFSTESVLSDYSAVTGFKKNDPNTDQGTDMEEYVNFWRKTGIADASGTRHQIGAFLDVDPGNITELWYAMWIGQAVQIGVEFPSQWMDAFNKGPSGLWGAVKRPTIDGGHCIVGSARTGGRGNIMTWGDDHPRLTVAGYQQFCDQVIVVVSQEQLHSGKTDEGYDWPGLLAALAEVTNQPAPAPAPAPTPAPTPTPAPSPSPAPKPVTLTGTFTGTFTPST
jgi:hypothetical protein